MDSYKLRIQSMLGTHHSWAVTMRSLIKEFITLDQDLYLSSVNGYEHCPEWVSSRVRDTKEFDIDFAYTLPRNFESRFRNKKATRLALYNYESSLLPEEWRGLHQHIDYALPSSEYSKNVFVDNGWPEDKCIVIPHGINLEDFKEKTKKIKLNTNKSFKFLNISIPHHRKNIGLLIEAFYSAFSEADDVVLILKTALTKPKYLFECDVILEIQKVQKKFLGKRLPQIEILQDRYESIIPLLNTCQVLISASASEGFGLPLLEGLAAGNLVIAPGATGQLDFLNHENSMLTESDEVVAGIEYQYWRPTSGSKVYKPRVEHLSQQMRDAFNDYQSLQDKFKINANETVKKFTWNRAARMILELKK